MFRMKIFQLFGGRLVLAAVHNPAMTGSRLISFERVEAGWFITISRGHYFLNIDWV